MDFLAQRSPRLLLRPAAPQQFGEAAAQSAARGDDRATTASNARVLRPAGSTFSLVIVQASIWPIRRSRSNDLHRPGWAV